MARLSKVNMHAEAKELAEKFRKRDPEATRRINQYVVSPGQRKLGVMIATGYYINKEDPQAYAKFVTEVLTAIAG